MQVRNIAYLFFLIFVLRSSFGFSQEGYKKLPSENPVTFRQYVVDETATLTPSQINTLNTKLSNEDITSSNQIIVYMIPGLDGESLEDLSMKLAEKNKIGRKDKNNGVLMLIVKDDRKIRIEVGYGLEGALTDAVSSSIIRNVITPSFKSGNYYEGITKGTDAVISAIKGEYTAEKNSDGSNGSTCCFGIPIFIVAIFGFIFIFMISSFIRRIFGFGRNIVAGKRGWRNSGGGWGGFGGGGSWGGGSSGGSSGGFSGGGGSFGGGGSSGSW
ncbi:MAG: TPM domain-containing protein [bacterium]